MPVGINEYQGIDNIYTDLIYYGFKSLETDGYPTCIWMGLSKFRYERYKPVYVAKLIV